MMPGANDDFEPCRDDKCLIERVHPAHTIDSRRKVITVCPRCEDEVELISLRNKRGLCPQCKWRGSIILERDEIEEPMVVTSRGRRRRRPDNA